MVFETERLRARPWRADDAEAAWAIYRDPEVVRYLGSTPRPVESLDAQRGWLDRVIDAQAAQPPGYGFWALETTGGTLVGASLLKALPDDDEVEVGWHLGRAHWGHGYATEGGRGALRHGFETLGLDVVHAVVVPENTASLAVAGRLGMAYQGETDRYYGRTLALFSLTPPAG